MMKKKTLIFTFASLGLLSLSLTACIEQPSGPVGKTKIDFGTIRSTPLDSITDQEELTYDELTSMINEKRSFALALYYDSGCSCWINFKPILTDYINDKNVDISYINTSEFNKKDNFGIYLVKSEMPSIVFFSQGKFSKQVVYGRDGSSIFTDKKKFYGFMEENINLPSMYCLEKNTLEQYIAEEKEMVLYVARSLCNDCGNVNKKYLYNWGQNYNGAEKLYIFDIQKYQGTDDYQTIKNWVGLSTVNNPILGYDTGMVPTFQKRKGDNILDMIVTNNDSLTVNNETKTLNSYFTSERVANMNFLKEEKQLKTILDKMEVEEKYATHYVNEEKGIDEWFLKTEFYQDYHYPLLNKFFETYFK